MVNRGVAPVDFETAVGQFRALYGDLSYVPLNPPEVGYGDFKELSDDEITVFLSSAGENVNRAIGNYYAAMAGQAAKTSESVKDFDLAVDNTKRPAALLELARYWWGLADEDDLNSEDAFQIVPTGKEGDFISEGTIPIYGRRYTWDRVR